MVDDVVVIGGGLAGSEAAWQAARQGCRVRLYEMRPRTSTAAHRTGNLAELVCSNSLGSLLEDRPLGLLKAELRRLGSVIMACADATAVPAGSALAVDRDLFAAEVTRRIEGHPMIRVCREEVTELPETGPIVVASGPLTSDPLASAIRRLTGEEYLHFYDAMAPIVTLESIDPSRTFRSARYGRGDGDYVNCPMTRVEYLRFVAELAGAETVPLRDFEAGDDRFFATNHDGSLKQNRMFHQCVEQFVRIGIFQPRKFILPVPDHFTNRNPEGLIQGLEFTQIQRSL